MPSSDRRAAFMRFHPPDFRVNSRRPGAATLEFAVVLPLIALIFFATLDSCAMVYLKEAMSIAAHEGGRLAIRRGASTEGVISVCEGFLSQRGIHEAVIETTPAELTDADPGELVSIRIAVSFDQFTWFLAPLYGPQTVELTFTVMKEQASPTQVVGESHDDDDDDDDD
jgi:hypothetical protein